MAINGLAGGDIVGLIDCSDGIPPQNAAWVEALEAALADLDLRSQRAKTICVDPVVGIASGPAEERAAELMHLFLDPAIKAIFDLWGGDAANHILPHLDFEAIAAHPKPFFGLSDLSVLLNALYARAGLPTFHFSVNTLHGAFGGEHASEQRARFKHLFMDDWRGLGDDFVTFDYTWLRGKAMHGPVIGGNIRCFLKLAGTPYLPDPAGHILLLESLNSGPERVATMLHHLDQIGIFARCAGLLLGTFSAMEAQDHTPTVEALALDITARYDLPVAKTRQLGHGPDAHCLPIGLPLRLGGNQNLRSYGDL